MSGEPDKYELMVWEFERLLKEAGEDGMTYQEFTERMTRLQWECEEIEQRFRKAVENAEKKPSEQSDQDTSGH
jgi:hypothetical protein